jgi:hypothetical protein
LHRVTSSFDNFLKVVKAVYSDIISGWRGWRPGVNFIRQFNFMLIKRINIVAAARGLGPIRLNGLGHIVALAGKNGSGKSRILDSIKGYIEVLPLPVVRDAVDFNQPFEEFIKDLVTKAPQGESTEATFKKFIKGNVKEIKYEPNRPSKLFLKTLPSSDNKGKLVAESEQRLIKLINSKSIEEIDLNLSSKDITEGLLKIANPLLKEDYQVTKKRKKEEDTVYYKLFTRLKYYVSS